MQHFHTETTAFGVTRRYFSDEKGNITVDTSQDMAAIIEHSKRTQIDRGKKITSEYANPIGMIPPVFHLKWLNEEGWNVFDADKDPSVEKKLRQKMNDPDYMWLRTSELRL